jgi:hypothetical protein
MIAKKTEDKAGELPIRIDTRLAIMASVLVFAIDISLVVKLFVDSGTSAALITGIVVVSCLMIIVLRINDIVSLAVGKSGFQAELRATQAVVKETKEEVERHREFIDALVKYGLGTYPYQKLKAIYQCCQLKYARGDQNALRQRIGNLIACV